MKKFIKDTSNFISFGIALIPSILLYVFQPTDQIPYALFVITVLLLILFIWLCAKLFLDSKEKEYPTIEIFKFHANKCLCKPNPYLSFNSIVSFYNNNNGFEEFLCYGYVETITEKGLVQIIILESENEKGFSYISTHQNDIIIKPTVRFGDLEKLEILL